MKTDLISIFFAVDDSYVQHLCVVMNSILYNNKNNNFVFYVMTDYISERKKILLEKLKFKYSNFDIVYFVVNSKDFENLIITSNHITRQTYYRYIIPNLVPNLKKVLYLDSDIIVNGDIAELWNVNIDDYYCAGVRDTFIHDSEYQKKLGFNADEFYINAGVLLLNLEKIRKDNKVKELFHNTEKYKFIIEYQDQDVINLTFKGKVKELPLKFNYTGDDVGKDPFRVLNNEVVIVHFTGGRKPWNYYFSSYNFAEFLYFKYLKKTAFAWEYFFKNFSSILKRFIFSKRRCGNLRFIRFLGLNFVYKKKVKVKNKDKIKVALLVDEFFGGAGTAFGGYGFLSRNYIAKYIPSKDIQMDVLLGFSSKLEKNQVDDVFVYRLPENKRKARSWLKRQDYDVFLSVELTSDSYRILALNRERAPLILWVQDPRPWYEWREINTVKLFTETCYWDTPVYEYVNYMNWKRKVWYITQGMFLKEKARDLYRLNNDVDMKYLPNPIEIDDEFDVKHYKKKNNIVFLGRLESVKRGWLFCEIARCLPEYNFYVIGKFTREVAKNKRIFDKYLDVPNLHFVGHLEGKEKEQYLKDAKILVNTSIHEALPISFLEALSYGTLLVSNRNPEELTSKFGVYVGEVLGDGFDKVGLYVDAIKQIINDDDKRKKMSFDAVKYVKQVHNVNDFVSNLRDLLFRVVRFY